jgi:hypothetical protein
MQEVGAQHLICVSMQGYPKSIIEDVAMSRGPTVRLLTLAELRDRQVSNLSLIYPFVLVEVPHYALERISPNLKLDRLPPERGFTLNSIDRVFTVDDSEVYQSLNELIAQVIHYTPAQKFLDTDMKAPGPYHLEQNLGSAESDLWLHLDNQQYKVMSLPVELIIESTVTKIPLTVYSYQQESTDGILAWIATATGLSEGKEVALQVVYKQNSEGFLQVAAIRQQGLQSVVLLVSQDKAVLENFVSQKLSIAH